MSEKQENMPLIFFQTVPLSQTYSLHCWEADGLLQQLLTHSGYFLLLGKIFIPKEKPIETRTEEKVTLDPELEEALASASDTELYDLAG